MDQQECNQLIIKQLSGEIGADEVARLRDALAADAAAMGSAKQFEKTWAATGELPEPKLELDLDAEFSRLKTRISADLPAEIGRTVWLEPRRHWSRIAAAAAILGLLCVGIWQFLPSKPAELAAGSNTAKSEIRLEDGSHIFINKSAKLTYPEHFSGKNRLVKLEGEAFFEIAKDAAKPFIIETKLAKIQVVGTKFNVKSTDGRCSVFVEEGHVIVENNGQTGHLTAGQGVTVFENGAKFQPDPRKNAAAWAHGSLRFDNTPLVEVLADLSDFYQVTITCEDENLQNRRFSWSKPVEGPLEDVLKILSTAFNARVEKVSEKSFKLVKN